MLLINTILENIESTQKKLKKKLFINFDIINEIQQVYNTKNTTQHKLNLLLSQKKNFAKKINYLIKEQKNKEIQIIKNQILELKKNIKILQNNLIDYKAKIYQLLSEIPNLPHENVPEGSNYKDNKIIFQNKKKIIIPNTPLKHWELSKKYQLINFELGTKITGKGFPVYLDKGAKLQRALIQFFLEYNSNQGYKEIAPPFIVNKTSSFSTGQLPDKENQMYHITNDDLYLIPTSEVPITNLYRNMLFSENDLPILNTSYSPCFRREAGSYGKKVRGLNRLHQFDKVEIVRIEHPDQSYAALDKMINLIKKLIEQLELPYRILCLCGGDMSFSSAITYDFEVWSGGQKKWLEVSSVSNFETFQSNRLNLKYKCKLKNKNKLCHTLNGSALAIPRIYAAILENNQSKDGIIIPKILHPYTKFKIIN